MTRKALITTFLTLLAFFATTLPARAGVSEQSSTNSYAMAANASQAALLATCSSSPPPWWFNFSTTFTDTNRCNKCLEMGRVWNARGYQSYCWTVADWRVELWLYHP
ncbi:hypothetical protein ACGFI3_26190 [Nonomuraea wenchangensis]|uniref:hypothetical protein n=1 Tax=Nonomuraea wenchangensis TaxID=568860 RepID=UPI003717E1DC